MTGVEIAGTICHCIVEIARDLLSPLQILHKFVPKLDVDCVRQVMICTDFLVQFLRQRL